LFHRCEDSRIGAAPTHVSLHFVQDLGIAWRWIPFEQRNGRHDHARRAIATLHRAGFEKSLLHWMKLTVPGKALDCGDSFAGDACDRGYAGTRRPAFDQNCARSTLSFAAAVLAAGHPDLIPQDFQQASIGFHVDRLTGAIDIQFHDRRHVDYSVRSFFLSQEFH
jgi:hypothetical protein